MNTQHDLLRKKILSGILTLSLFSCAFAIYAPAQAEAASTSLYDEYQQAQRLAELKAQVAQMRQDLAKDEAQQKQAKKAEQSDSPAVASKAANGDTASSFVDRVAAILDRYEPNNKYREYLKNQHAAQAATPAADASDIQGKKETEQALVPVKTEPAKAKKPVPQGETLKDIEKRDTPNVDNGDNSDADNGSGALPAIPSSGATTGASGTYTFDWKGTPLAQSVYGVAKRAGKGVVVNGDLKGSVFMSLKNVTCDQALDYLARAFGLNWMADGDNIIVSVGTEMLQSRIFPIGYANKDNLVKEITALGVKADNIFANTETGTISVTGTPYQLEEAQRRISALDKPVAQCLLLAQMIEINHGKDVNLGFSYTLPTYSHSANETGDGSSLHGKWLDKLTFSASSQASRELNKGKVIARPMVMALNGQKGVVDFGDRVPILTRTDTGSTNSLTVTYENVGTSLTITPTINEKTGDITLNVKTEVSNITGWVTSGDTRAPQMSTRKAETSAHVKSGQSFVIGGLMSAKELDNLSGIPGLMNLPILGKLFSYHQRTRDYGEVYIMITPFIVSDSTNTRDMYDELKYLDHQAKSGDITVPERDWAKGIGKHRQTHTVAE